MLTNFDLKHIAKEMNLNLIGVYSKDKLPFKRVAGSYIVNLTLTSQMIFLRSMMIFLTASPLTQN